MRNPHACALALATFFSFGLAASGASSAATVPNATASLALTASSSDVLVGEKISLTATLRITGSSAPSIGTYSIYDGSAALVSGASANITNGFADSIALGAGKHVLTAKYAGTVNSLTATSNSVTVEVNPAAALTVIGKLLVPAYVGSEYSGADLAASGGKAPYKWSLAAGSSMPLGLSLSSGGSISGNPKTANSKASFKVDVKDSSSPARTGSATIDLPVYPAVPRCNAAGSSSTTLKWLTGNYAFHIDQIDMTGSGDLSWIVGQFKADGQGHITDAIFDSNGPSYNSEQSGALSGGSYKIGSDGRGELSLMSPGGAITECIAVASLKNGVAGGGQFVEADATDTVAHGIFYAQGTAAATETSVRGSWAFGIQGGKIHQDGAETRQAAAGYLTLNGSGEVAGGELDLSNDETSGSGFVNQYIPRASIAGTYKVAADGRGTLSLELSQGGGTKQAVNFVFYMAGAGQMFLLESDAATGSESLGSMTGRAYLRTASTFNDASLSGNSVFISNGLSINGQILGPKTQAGILKWDKSDSTASGAIDVNEDGHVTLAPDNTFSSNYSVDPEGRATFTGAGGSAPVFYLVGPNSGFGVEANTAVDASEIFNQSAPSGGFTATSLSGGYAMGSIWYGFIDQIASSGEAVFNTSSKTATSEQDANQAGVIALGQTSTVSYEAATDGRFILVDHGQNSTALYLVSKDLAFGINISGDASQPLTEVDFFEQNP
jgi:hypothetical protein